MYVDLLGVCGGGGAPPGQGPAILHDKAKNY
jgi:hypothetical protein